MSNTRFGLIDGASAGAILNGDGVGPNRSEVPPYVMERVLTADRRALCVLGAPNDGGGFAWTWVLDFGGPITFSAAAALAVEQSGIASVQVGVYSAYPSMKSSAMNLIHNGRDWGGAFAPKTGNPWYFMFTGSGLQSVGGLRLYTVSDLGVVGYPDFQTDPFRIRTEIDQTDGSIVLNEDLGRMGQDFQMEFYARNSTELAKYEALIARPGSIVLFDDIDRTYEVIVTGGRLGRKRARAAGATAYQITLQMKRMP